MVRKWLFPSLFLVSWSIGIFYLFQFYTPTAVIPLFDNFYWASTYTAMLGLTTALTVLYGLGRLLLKHRKLLIYTNALTLFLLVTIGFQLKVAAFNLEICH